MKTTYRRILRRRVEAALRLRVSTPAARKAIETTVDPFDELKTVPVLLDVDTPEPR